MTDTDIALAGALIMEIAKGDAEVAVAAVETLITRDQDATVIEQGDDTRGWTVRRVDGIETFTRPDGVQFVRARESEDADVIVKFRAAYLPSMRLVDRSESATVRRAERKKRREQREMRKRGYDV